MIELLNEYWRAFLFGDGARWSGLAVTLWLTVISAGIGFLTGIPLAVARVSSRRWLSTPVWLYTYLIRGTPLYIQLLLVYTGLYSFEWVRSAPVLGELLRQGMYCALIAFAINTAAYTTEIFAGAIRETAAGEIEAARAYGFSGLQMYLSVILPSALRRALPAYSNEVIFLLHATSIAFAVTVKDVLAVARDANASTYRSFESFGIAAALYMATTFVLIWLFHLAERRWLVHLRRA